MHKHTSGADRDREEGELQVHERAGPESSGAVPVLRRQECIPVLGLFIKPPVLLREGHVLSFYE